MIPSAAARGFVLLVAGSALGGVSCGPLDLHALPVDGESRVLVVANGRDLTSLRLADHYARARRVRPTHVLRIDCTREEHISRELFDREIVEPLGRFWRECADSLRPDFVVLCGSFPLGVTGAEGRPAERAALDSDLALLPQLAYGTQPSLVGRARNPYFDAPGRPPFDQSAHGIVLVTRLAAFSEEAAHALIERSVAAGATETARRRLERGLFLFDQRGGEEETGQRWLRAAAESVKASGARAELDTVADFVWRARELAGYAAWGSNDVRYRRDLDFGWLPGALATEFVSTSARTFREPPRSWRPGRGADPGARYGGSTQSLALDLIESGATGVAGHVYEPFLDACPRPQVLFPAYLSGRTLAEAYYLSIPYLSWMTVVVGDPLCAPFAGRNPHLTSPRPSLSR